MVHRSEKCVFVGVADSLPISPELVYETVMKEELGGTGRVAGYHGATNSDVDPVVKLSPGRLELLEVGLFQQGLDCGAVLNGARYFQKELPLRTLGRSTGNQAELALTEKSIPNAARRFLASLTLAVSTKAAVTVVPNVARLRPERVICYSAPVPIDRVHPAVGLAKQVLVLEKEIAVPR